MLLYTYDIQYHQVVTTWVLRETHFWLQTWPLYFPFSISHRSRKWTKWEWGEISCSEHQKPLGTGWLEPRLACPGSLALRCLHSPSRSSCRPQGSSGTAKSGTSSTALMAGGTGKSGGTAKPGTSHTPSCGGRGTRISSPELSGARWTLCSSVGTMWCRWQCLTRCSPQAPLSVLRHLLSALSSQTAPDLSQSCWNTPRTPQTSSRMSLTLSPENYKHGE